MDSKSHSLRRTFLPILPRCAARFLKTACSAVWALPPPLPSAKKERREKQRTYSQGYFEYQARVIADRKVNPRDDLVSLLVSGEVDGESLNDEEILQESLLILIGGDGLPLRFEDGRWAELPGIPGGMLRWPPLGPVLLG